MIQAQKDALLHLGLIVFVGLPCLLFFFAWMNPAFDWIAKRVDKAATRFWAQWLP